MLNVRKRFKKISVVALKVLLVIFLNIAVPLVSLELFVRVWNPFQIKRQPHGAVILRSYSLYAKDDTFAGQPFVYKKNGEVYQSDDLMYKWIPNVSFDYSSEEFHVRGTANADGYYDDPFEMESASRPFCIALLGDSFSEGKMVLRARRFDRLLEQKLTKDLGYPVVIYNFGTAGFTTIHEWFLYKGKVVKFFPDMVLVMPFLTNDIVELMRPLPMVWYEHFDENGKQCTPTFETKRKAQYFKSPAQEPAPPKEAVSGKPTLVSPMEPELAGNVIPGETVASLFEDAGREPEVPFLQNPKQFLKQLLRRHCRLYKYFRDAMFENIRIHKMFIRWGLTQKKSDEFFFERDITVQSYYYFLPQIAKYYDILKSLILEFKKDAARRRLPLTVVSLPWKHQVNAPKFLEEWPSGDPEGLENDFQKFLNDSHIDTIALLPDIKAYPNADRELFFKYDGHLTEKGNVYLARILEPALLERIKKIHHSPR